MQAKAHQSSASPVMPREAIGRLQPLLNVVEHAMTYDTGIPASTYIGMLQSDGADMEIVTPVLVRALENRWVKSRGREARSVGVAMTMLGTAAQRLVPRCLIAQRTIKDEDALISLSEGIVTSGTRDQVIAGIETFVEKSEDIFGKKRESSFLFRSPQEKQFIASRQVQVTAVNGMAELLRRRLITDLKPCRASIESTLAGISGNPEQRWLIGSMMMTMGTRAIPAVPWVKQTQEWVSSIIRQGREPLLDGEARPFILSPDDQTRHLAQRLCSWVEQQDPAWVIQHEPIPRTIMAMGITGRIPFGTAPALDGAHHDRILRLCAVLTGAANSLHGS